MEVLERWFSEPLDERCASIRRIQVRVLIVNGDMYLDVGFASVEEVCAAAKPMCPRLSRKTLGLIEIENESSYATTVLAPHLSSLYPRPKLFSAHFSARRSRGWSCWPN